LKRALGVCYYPEHWDEAVWAEDAARMAEAGIGWVRIGEFAWSRMEPEPGRFDWDWLDRAIDTLGAAGLKVVLGTPTATPPRWMLSRHPDMLAVDAEGRPRGFGSRRHYDFSHDGYREECRRIAKALGERYGRHPHVQAWQIDNEYDCHGTTLSYSDAAAPCLPRLARAALPVAGGAEPGLGQRVLVDGVPRLGRDRPAEPDGDRTEPGPCHGLPPLRLGSGRPLQPGAGGGAAEADRPALDP
jgi:beta-galactosidase GanA